jgi:hypothetical protein
MEIPPIYERYFDGRAAQLLDGFDATEPAPDDHYSGRVANQVAAAHAEQLGGPSDRGQARLVRIRFVVDSTAMDLSTPT